MRLNAPTKLVWYISIILAALGVVATFIDIQFVSTYAFWFVVVAFVLLTLSTFMKGL
jgi:hypothetical protein